ncbi:MAG: hypothetical protein R2734_03905 [Nocardioides sp.]
MTASPIRDHPLPVVADRQDVLDDLVERGARGRRELADACGSRPGRHVAEHADPAPGQASANARAAVAAGSATVWNLLPPYCGVVSRPSSAHSAEIGELTSSGM